MTSKLPDPEFINFISNYDIICLVETFLSTEIEIDGMPDFDKYWSPGIKISNYGRCSGGVLVFVRNNLRPYVKEIKNNFDNCITLKLSRMLFETDNDVAMICTYIPPAGSPYYRNLPGKNGVMLLEQCIIDLHHDNFSSFILCGDLNSRTSNVQPYVDFISDFDFNSNLSFTEKNDKVLDYQRISEDTFINDFGKYLNEICDCYDLVFLNGMTKGDEKGQFTYISPHGNSVNDYFIVSENLVPFMSHLNVLNYVFSWHLPLELTVNFLNFYVPTENENGSHYDSIEEFSYIKWDNDKLPQFRSALSNECCTAMLNEASNILPENPDRALELFDSTLKLAAADMIYVMKENKPKRANSEWFDYDCRRMKKVVHRNLNRYRRTKQNCDKTVYVNNRKKYKNMIKDKRKHFNGKRVTIIKANLKDSSSFWAQIKKVCKKSTVNNQITPQQWITHFKSVFNSNSLEKPPICDEIILDTPEPENIAPLTNLDAPITTEEVAKGIKNLKTGKAAGPDGIGSEILKSSLPVIINFLTQLCNHIFQFGMFPVEWTKSILVPIFKKGNPNNTDNYRGVSLSPVVSKVYTDILHDRVSDWAETNDIIVEEQAGFRKSYSTIDHIFTIYSMVQRQFDKGQKLYVAFVDFRKAFDFVNRDALWHIIDKTGIRKNSKMYNALRAMYKNVLSSVRCGNKGISDYFDCPLGVKQGCKMSPKLFTLFINELAKEVARNGKHGVQMIPNAVEIMLLLFADDLVLISQTPLGLQNQLNQLEIQTKRLGLIVNLEKTKIMVFRKGGHLSKFERWTFSGESVEVVNSYVYLGIELSTRLSTSVITSKPAVKAKKAVNEILKCLSSLQSHDLDLFSTLFSSKVQPIMLYGSEIWGVYDSVEIERVQTYAYKRFLNVSIHCSNKLLYGDVGRYPLKVYTKVNAIRYWLKIIKLAPSRLCHQAYTMLVNSHEKGRLNWVTEVRNLLCKNGFGIVWTMQTVGCEKTFLSELKQRLKDCYLQEWRVSLRENEDYALYNSCKSVFEPEKYLLFGLYKPYRDALVKFRMRVSPIYNIGIILCIYGIKHALFVHSQTRQKYIL